MVASLRQSLPLGTAAWSLQGLLSTQMGKETLAPRPSLLMNLQRCCSWVGPMAPVATARVRAQRCQQASLLPAATARVRGMQRCQQALLWPCSETRAETLRSEYQDSKGY